MMELPKLIEELHHMLEKKIDARCSIESISLDGTATQKVCSSISHHDLEQAIPLLFQADIDQWTLTDISTEVYMAETGPRTFISLKLMRCL